MLVLRRRSFHTYAMSHERREFVRVLHSNAEGQPRSKIKPSKEEGKKWEIVPGDRDFARYRSYR